MATYGKQIRLVTGLLVPLAEKQRELNPRGAATLKELMRIQAEIELIKDIEYEKEVQDIQARIDNIRKRRPVQTKALVSSLKAASASGGAL